MGQKSSLSATNLATSLETRKPGLIQTLEWSRKAISDEIAEDEVEVLTAIVGLSFKVSRRSYYR